MKIVKDMRPLVKIAEESGWTVSLRRNGHLRWDSPTGATVYTSATPSDWRAIARIKCDLRANGLVL